MSIKFSDSTAAATSWNETLRRSWSHKSFSGLHRITSQGIARHRHCQHSGRPEDQRSTCSATAGGGLWRAPQTAEPIRDMVTLSFSEEGATMPQMGTNVMEQRIRLLDLGAHRVIANCNQQNAASWRLLERCGLTREVCSERTPTSERTSRTSLYGPTPIGTPFSPRTLGRAESDVLQRKVIRRGSTARRAARIRAGIRHSGLNALQAGTVIRPKFKSVTRAVPPFHRHPAPGLDDKT